MPPVQEAIDSAMMIAINKPELKRYIQEQLSAGRFSSADELVAHSLARFIAEEETVAEDHEIDDSTADRLNQAYARHPRGEGGRTIEEAREILLGRRCDK